MTDMHPPTHPSTPTVPPRSSEREKNNRYLRALAIGHYVVSDVICLFSFLYVSYIVIGILSLTDTLPSGGEEGMPVVFGLVFLILGIVIVLLGLALAVLVFLAGRFLTRRAHYKFCFVVAAVEILFQPLGMVLGVFTILVLLRDGVKAQFQAGQSAEADEPDDGLAVAGVTR